VNAVTLETRKSLVLPQVAPPRNTRGARDREPSALDPPRFLTDGSRAFTPFFPRPGKHAQHSTARQLRHLLRACLPSPRSSGYPPAAPGLAGGRAGPPRGPQRG